LPVSEGRVDDSGNGFGSDDALANQPTGNPHQGAAQDEENADIVFETNGAGIVAEQLVQETMAPVEQKEKRSSLPHAGTDWKVGDYCQAKQ
jgi:hypothetical protein